MYTVQYNNRIETLDKKACKLELELTAIIDNKGIIPIKKEILKTIFELEDGPMKVIIMRLGIVSRIDGTYSEKGSSVQFIQRRNDIILGYVQ